MRLQCGFNDKSIGYSTSIRKFPAAQGRRRRHRKTRHACQDDICYDPERVQGDSLPFVKVSWHRLLWTRTKSPRFLWKCPCFELIGGVVLKCSRVLSLSIDAKRLRVGPHYAALQRGTFASHPRADNFEVKGGFLASVRPWKIWIDAPCTFYEFNELIEL